MTWKENCFFTFPVVEVLVLVPLALPVNNFL